MKYDGGWSEDEMVENPLCQRRQSPRYRNKPMPSFAEKDLCKRVLKSNANKEVQLAKEEIRKNNEKYQEYQQMLKVGRQIKTETGQQHHQQQIELVPEIQVKVENKKKRGRPIKKEIKEGGEDNEDQLVLKRGRQIQSVKKEQSQTVEALPEVVIKTGKKKRGRPLKKENKAKKIKLERNTVVVAEEEASTFIPIVSKEEEEEEAHYCTFVHVSTVVEKQHKVIFGRDDHVENLFNSSIRNPTGYESLELWVGPIKPCNRPRLVEAINNILDSSADTLIKITRFEPVLAGQKIPVMEKLESIRFSHWAGSLKAPFLPRDCDPKICFPKLTEVYLDHLGYGNRTWQECFPPTRARPEVVFPTVKTLKLNSDASQFLDKLGAAFPKCTNLSFEFMFYEFPEKAAGIWENFPRLEYLKIQRKVVPEDNKNFSFDTAFTGFSSETCSKLFKMNPNQRKLIKPREISNYRKNSSIIKLKNLKQLVLDLYIWDYKDGITALSKLSGLYAFKMIPELEVKLITRYLYNEHEGLMTGLDSVAPFVHTVTRG